MKHGANIYKYAKKLKSHPDKIVDFSSNINSYHPKIKIKLSDNLITKYADSSYSDLKKSISKKYKIKKSQIALYNGASCAIFELMSSLKQEKVCLYAPLYSEYEKAISQDKKVIKINRFTDLYKRPEKDSIVVFVNPSTPDGTYYHLGKLFSIWKEQNCTVILDESFLQFEDLRSIRDEISSYENLYIIQSFSKFYSCAGVRIGAIFSNKKNIKSLKIPLWNLSSFDCEFLSKRLKSKGFEKKSKKLHIKHKKELFNTLKDSNLFEEIYESDSNFFLTKSEKANEIFEHLLKNRILVRTCGSFDFLSNDYLRFAVKETTSHKKLKKVLDEIS